VETKATAASPTAIARMRISHPLRRGRL
jgi:hypothetical protein